MHFFHILLLLFCSNNCFTSTTAGDGFSSEMVYNLKGLTSISIILNVAAMCIWVYIMYCIELKFKLTDQTNKQEPLKTSNTSCKRAKIFKIVCINSLMQFMGKCVYCCWHRIVIPGTLPGFSVISVMLQIWCKISANNFVVHQK